MASVQVEADRRFRAAAAKRGACEAEEIEAAIVARREAAHRLAGFGSFFEYAEHVMQLDAHTVATKLRVVEALETLPKLREALSTGTLKPTGVRELVRVVTPETEGAWIEAAVGKPVREIQKMVSGRVAGDEPDDPPDPDAVIRILRLEVTGRGDSAMRELRTLVDRQHGERLDDDSFIEACLRAFHTAMTVEKGDDSGEPRYEVVITADERTEKTTIERGGRSYEVDVEVLNKAMCDSSIVQPAHVGRADCHCGCKGTGITPPRIPKKLRRAVKRRDRNRCRVPGCRNHCNLDVHHLWFWLHGGPNELWNLITLCEAHHMALHRGTLLIRGDHADHVTFHHPDGSPYGSVPAENRPTWAANAIPIATA